MLKNPSQLLEGISFMDAIARSPIEEEILNELVAVHKEGQPVTLKPCGTVLQVVPPSSPSALATVLLRLLLVPSSSSALQPWLQLLPTVGDSPLQWSPGDLELMRGTTLHLETEQFLATAAHSFKILDEHFFQPNRNTFPKSLFTEENFMWAYHLVVSRSYILGEGGYERRVMLPKADMLNHGIVRASNAEETPSRLAVANAAVRVIEGSPATFVVEAVTPIRDNEEVLINYGRLTNAELLMQYGFMLDDNPLDARSQSVRQALATVAPQELLDSFVTQLAEISDAEENRVENVKLCQEWDLLLTVAAGDLSGGPTDRHIAFLKSHKRHLKVCIEQLQDSLDACSTTVDQDRQLLAGRSLNAHQTLAVKGRLEEKVRTVDTMLRLKTKSLLAQAVNRNTEGDSPSPSLAPSTSPKHNSPSTAKSVTVTPMMSPTDNSHADFSSAISNANPRPLPSADFVPTRESDSDGGNGVTAAKESEEGGGGMVTQKQREPTSEVSRAKLAQVERLKAQQKLMEKMRLEINAMGEDVSVITDAVWRDIPQTADDREEGRYEHQSATTIAILVATISTEDISSALELPLVGILTESFVKTLCSSELTTNCKRKAHVANGEIDVSVTERENSARRQRREESHVMTESRREAYIASGEGREEEEFSFVFYIGFDEGDPFYDSEYNMRQMSLAFNVLSLKYPGVHFQIFRHRETKGKPVWVWNELANIAYHDGCDYLFQVNDDMRFLTADWAPYLVAQLRESPIMPNFGVTGPRDIRRNLLTQAFVHRTHLELFKGYMFPRSFFNWYMDDWVQNVYGGLVKGACAVVPSSLPESISWPETENSPHQPRYEIDHAGYEHLNEDLVLGCQLIQAWLNKMGYVNWYNWQCTVMRQAPGPPGASVRLLPQEISLSSRPEFSNMQDPYFRALSQVARNGEVVLTFTNWGVMDMTRNWLAYARMWALPNYLVIALDEPSYVALEAASVPVHFEPSHAASSEVQEYLEGDYRKLVNLKTYYTWQALGRGIDVFLCDNDVVFLRHPYEGRQFAMDVHYQDDTQKKERSDPSVALNSGFVVVRSNYRTLDLYEQAYQLTQREEEYQDQRALNVLLHTSHRHRVQLEVLDAAEYPNGWSYFVSRLPQRAGIVPAVIHNNWLQGHVSKVHRFREELLWTVDPDAYYADPALKLLTLSLRRYGEEEEEPIAQQTLDLAVAMVLARRLGRTLVLPRLHVYGSLREEWGLEKASAEMFYDIGRIADFVPVRESTFVVNPVLKDMRQRGVETPLDRGMIANLVAVGKGEEKLQPSNVAAVLGGGSLVRVASSAVLQIDSSRGPGGRLQVNEFADFLAPAVADVGTLVVHCADVAGGHLSEHMGIGRLDPTERQELFHALALRSRGPHRPVDD